MKRSGYGQPILIQDDTVSKLERVEAFDERFIQDLVFKNADCLPIAEIDDIYSPAIPVCTELNTGVGPLDVLMVTPSGRLTVIETKLWRNPEARRKVIAQILDYAKELAKWTYEDLQREINKRLHTSGNTLYRIVSESGVDESLEEAVFVDSVSRNLRRGNFLLLIVGDGIREGAAGIADFLSTAGYLEFSFALVELAIYKQADSGTLVIPRVIARTVELQRMIVEIPEGLTIREASSANLSNNNSVSTLSPEKAQERDFYIKFWHEFVSELSFDDPAQPIPDPATSTNLFIYLTTKQVWISAYFMKSSKRVGVYFRCSNTQLGQKIAAQLEHDQEEMIKELGPNVIWNIEEVGGGAGVRLACDDVFLPENRNQIKDFFAEWTNNFVNVFRPRVKRIVDEL